MNGDEGLNRDLKRKLSELQEKYHALEKKYNTEKTNHEQTANTLTSSMKRYRPIFNRPMTPFF